MASKVFDHIIVGAGSSGAALAARLSEKAAKRICLLEAGPSDSNLLHSAFIKIPMMVGLMVMKNKHSNWNYNTTKQPGLKNRKIFQPRGKTLGGSSSLNGMVYQRGNPADYDEWESWGNMGWGYKDMLPYFRKMENCAAGANEFRAEGGPINVAFPPSINPLTHDFVKAGVEAGYPYQTDFNSGGMADQEGIGLFEWTQKGGLRCSSSRGYLTTEVRNRPNLTILTGHHATKILLDGKRAVGVQVKKGPNENSQDLECKGDIIISGGALNSPQLLMLSGIGPKQHLNSVGVGCVHDLQGVGEHLEDHLNLAVMTRESGSLSHNLSLGSMHRWAFSPLQLMQGTGMLTTTFAEAGGFIHSSGTMDKATTRCDLQFHFYPSKIKRNMEMSSIIGHGYGVQLCLLRPKSQGTLRLQSSDPFQAPAIDPNYLANEDDLRVMVDGVRAARRIMAQPALAKHSGGEIVPGEAAQSQGELEDFVKEYATTIFHPTGTCKMGPAKDTMAVVDDTLRVHGLQHLRVADASIMPRIVGGNTNAPCMAIGEKAADMILRDSS